MHPSHFHSNSNRKIKSLGSKDTQPQSACEKPVRLHFYQLRASHFPESINRFFGGGDSSTHSSEWKNQHDFKILILILTNTHSTFSIYLQQKGKNSKKAFNKVTGSIWQLRVLDPVLNSNTSIKLRFLEEEFGNHCISLPTPDQSFPKAPHSHSQDV